MESFVQKEKMQLTRNRLIRFSISSALITPSSRFPIIDVKGFACAPPVWWPCALEPKTALDGRDSRRDAVCGFKNRIDKLLELDDTLLLEAMDTATACNGFSFNVVMALGLIKLL